MSAPDTWPPGLTKHDEYAVPRHIGIVRRHGSEVTVITAPPRVDMTADEAIMLGVAITKAGDEATRWPT